LNDLSFDSIREVEAIWLERAIEEEKVFEVLKIMNNKALGPNTLTMVFF
jgi:hypothetical protein